MNAWPVLCKYFVAENWFQPAKRQMQIADLFGVCESTTESWHFDSRYRSLRQNGANCS